MAELKKFLQEQLSATDFQHEARWIEEFVRAGKQAASVEAASSQRFSDPLLQQSFEICERRKRGEPLAYIFGSWAFREHEFFCGPGVLIPRPETEELVDLVCAHAFKGMPDLETIHIADLGAGTGCLGISIALELARKWPLKNISLTLVEKSVEAFSYLKKNADALLRLEKMSVVLENKDWNELNFGKTDILVSNPPYLSEDEFQKISLGVRAFEPKEALVPLKDPSGYAAYRELVNLVRVLRPQLVAFELGTFHAPWIEQAFRESVTDYKIGVHADMAQKPRFFVGTTR